MPQIDPKDPQYWTNKDGCPRLFLAPMEGLGDVHFRRAMAVIGGFDEASTEFFRVPKNAHVPSLARKYHPHQTGDIPEACQIMGGDPELVGQMAAAMEARGAPRLDLNCGCPSNKVTGRGAGSSLLKEPEHLHAVAKAMVEACTVPVTAKLRSGFEDTSLFKENLLAAQEAGIAFLALHPRTRAEGYRGEANWDLTARAKELLDIPVIGNGDVRTAEDAQRLLKHTNCDGIMVGRGAVYNPWLFHEIKCAFSGEKSPRNWEQTERYMHCFADSIDPAMPQRTQVNKLKAMAKHLLWEVDINDLLRSRPDSPAEFLDELLATYAKLYS